MYGVKVAGVGHYLPKRKITNNEIAAQLLMKHDFYLTKGKIQASDSRIKQFKSDSQWIVERTGIHIRREADITEASSDLAIYAAREALENAKVYPKYLDFILIATVTEDHPHTPSTASIVQHALGVPVEEGGILHNVLTCDISAACSSFMMALEQGDALIRSGKRKIGLVIGTDVLTRAINRNDRSMLSLFGDAAGAFVLRRVDRADDYFGISNFFAGSDGSQGDLLKTRSGGSRCPVEKEMIDEPFNQPHRLQMKGNAVFKVMSRIAVQAIEQLLKRVDIPLSDVHSIILHQANGRITKKIENELREKGFQGSIPGGVMNGDAVGVHNGIWNRGNTTSASIPLLFYEELEQENIKPNTNVVFFAFGGGLSWSGAFMRWRG
jgi:3-oxoacyl-[acyl-carrier-protein] synthase III